MHAPVHRLPPEILHQVLKLAASHAWRTTLSCSSVCSEWRTLSLPILLRTVSFSIHPGDRTTKGRKTAEVDIQDRNLRMFLDILDRYPGLSNAIFEIIFKFSSKHTPFGRKFFSALLEHIPSKCKRIRKFSIWEADTARAWRGIDLHTKLQCFTEVETVLLDQCTFRASDLQTFNSAFPLLKHIDVGSRFVLDEPASHRKGNETMGGVDSSTTHHLSMWCASKARDNFAALCSFLQSELGIFRNVTVLTIGLPEDFVRATPHFGSYIAHLGPTLKHLQLYGCYCIAPELEGTSRLDLTHDLALDLSKNTSLQSLVLRIENMATASFVAAMKSTKHPSLRRVLWRIPELTEDELRAEFVLLEKSLPSSVQELCFFDPVASRYRVEDMADYFEEPLASDWQAVLKEIFASTVRRGVDVQTMSLTFDTYQEVSMLIRQWEKIAVAHV